MLIGLIFVLHLDLSLMFSALTFQQEFTICVSLVYLSAHQKCSTIDFILSVIEEEE